MKTVKPIRGRPKQPPTTVMHIPVSKIPMVEKLLKREIAVNQEATVNVRVPKTMVAIIREKLNKGK